MFLNRLSRYISTGASKINNMHAEKGFFDFTVKDIDGKDFKLADHKGKVHAFLIVNVASACGYTDANYKQLTELYKELNPKGLQILAFPCNQFGAQEKACELDIKKFAQEKYHANFPMFSKVEVNGAGAAPLFQFLKKAAHQEDIKWNFSKFLVDRNGHVVKSYSSDKSPSQIKADILPLLQ